MFTEEDFRDQVRHVETETAKEELRAEGWRSAEDVVDVCKNEQKINS